jgi:hypothetical protein
MNIHQRLTQLETKLELSGAMAESRIKLRGFLDAVGAEPNADIDAEIRAFLDNTDDGAYDD